MNLKEVARRLDVHYQSVYRWVRSGELEALRFGARYDVSEAALRQFLARRRPADDGEPLPAAEPPQDPRRAADLSRADALEELEAFALDPVVSTASVVALAARRGSSVLGDLCVVAHLDASGTADVVSAEHPDVDRATFARAALEIGAADASSPAGMAAFDYEQRQVLRVAHVPQDRVQRALPLELRQYWPKYAVYSLLAVPILLGRAVCGVMRYSRDRPNSAVHGRGRDVRGAVRRAGGCALRDRRRDRAGLAGACRARRDADRARGVRVARRRRVP